VVKVTNNSASVATNIFLDVAVPEPYLPFNNPTGAWDSTAREVRWWVAAVAPGESVKYTVVVRVSPTFAERVLVPFVADMTYDQNGFMGLTGSSRDEVDTGVVGDGDLQLSTNTPGPPDWLRVRVHLGQAGDVSLRIYNTAGELVRVLLDKYPGNEREVILKSWDGKNKNGETVAAGVYILHAIMPHTTKLAKVVVLH